MREKTTKSIFELTNVGSMSLKNRLFRAATGDKHAINGHYQEGDFELYRELAKGGVGTIITGFAYVSDYPMAPGPGMLGIYDDSFIPEYKKLTDMVHENGANIVLQIVHCGSFVFGAAEGTRIIAPSVVPHAMTNTVPEEMTKADIDRVVQDFVLAAKRAKESGFDGIEIHAGHGFLLSQFISPYYNKRTDEYGGTDENRARMAVEVVSSIREVVGADYPILIKINGNDGIEGGLTQEGFICAGKLLEKAGVNIISVSGAWFAIQKDTPYYLEETKVLAEACNIPVCLVGGVRDAETIEDVLNNSDIEYVAMSRPFINALDFPNKWASKEILTSTCTSCNGCTAPESGGKCVI